MYFSRKVDGFMNAGIKTRVPGVKCDLRPLMTSSQGAANNLGYRLGPLSPCDDVIIGLKSHLKPGTHVLIPQIMHGNKISRIKSDCFNKPAVRICDALWQIGYHVGNYTIELQPIKSFYLLC